MEYVYYEIKRSRTSKFAGQEDYHCWDKDTIELETRSEVEQWLFDNYENCKRSKMYRDGIQNEAIHIGYIYCYKDSNEEGTFYCQDWIEIRHVVKTTETVLFRPKDHDTTFKQ